MQTYRGCVQKRGWVMTASICMCVNLCILTHVHAHTHKERKIKMHVGSVPSTHSISCVIKHPHISILAGFILAYSCRGSTVRRHGSRSMRPSVMLHQQFRGERKQEVGPGYKLSKLSPSDILPPAILHLQKVP